MFITPLFIITPNWKQLKCVPTEYRDKLSYILYYGILLGIQRNRLLVNAMTWMNSKIFCGVKKGRCKIQTMVQYTTWGGENGLHLVLGGVCMDV
jgi:hypothetical protein